MAAVRTYVDSSVFGGVCDDEFADDSLRFFDQVRSSRFSILSSVLVADEIAQAPQPVRGLFESLLPSAELVQVTPAVIGLQEAYLAAGIVSSKWADDALHVALATAGGADLIVSWNFRHIVHFEKVPRYNAVNRLQGWGQVAIHAPSEVIRYEDEDV
jgi:predicted nucleic acid-binding protein